MVKNALNKNKMIIVGCIVIIGMVIGSLYDYQISQMLFNIDSGFGKVFAAYGQLPVTLGSAIIGFMLFYIAERKFKITTILAYLFGGFSYLMAIIMAITEPMMYLGLPVIVAVILGLAEITLVSYFTYHFSQGVSKKDLKTFTCFLAFVIYGQMILINVVKLLAARPRMRMIAVTPEASFQPWWVFGSEMKTTLMATLGIASEEFKSFPSGHAGCATVSMAYCIIPFIKHKTTSNPWFYIGLVFTLLVMISRIIMGAHFVSDVTVGFGLSFMIIIIANFIFYRKDVCKDE